MVYLRHPLHSNDPPGHGKGKTSAREDKNHVPRGLEYIPSGRSAIIPVDPNHDAVIGTKYLMLKCFVGKTILML